MFYMKIGTMKRSILSIMILLVPLLSCKQSNKSMSELSLRSLAKARGIKIGAAVGVQPLKDESQYKETLAREFNILTPENAMKFEPIHPDINRYDFAGADAIVDFAKTNGMQVRGHTLVWHNQLPLWVTTGKWPRNELTKILREHISTVVGRYQGRILSWDVINEAVDDNGFLRDTIWLRGIGSDYIDMVFRWAHEADPKALLFYNDYGGEGLGQKSDAIYNLVKDLKKRGVPIDGVGFQAHFDLKNPPRMEDVATNIKRLAELGLEVHITEMDVRIEEPVTEEKLAEQARIYREMIEVCLSCKNCKAFVMWGFTDRHSWIPWFFHGWSSGLILDKSYRPKPAYKALRNALSM